VSSVAAGPKVQAVQDVQGMQAGQAESQVACKCKPRRAIARQSASDASDASSGSSVLYCKQGKGIV